MTCSKTQRQQTAKINMHVCSCAKCFPPHLMKDTFSSPSELLTVGKKQKKLFPGKVSTVQTRSTHSAIRSGQGALCTSLILLPREPGTSAISRERRGWDNPPCLPLPLMFILTRGHLDEDQRQPWRENNATNGCLHLRAKGAAGQREAVFLLLCPRDETSPFSLSSLGVLPFSSPLSFHSFPSSPPTSVLNKGVGWEVL